MTTAPFLRFALLVLCTGYVLAIVVAWVRLSPAAAIVALAGGTLVAVVMSIEVEADDSEERAATADRIRHRLRFRPDVQRRLRERGEL